MGRRAAVLHEPGHPGHPAPSLPSRAGELLSGETETRQRHWVIGEVLITGLASTSQSHQGQEEERAAGAGCWLDPFTPRTELPRPLSEAIPPGRPRAASPQQPRSGMSSGASTRPGQQHGATLLSWHGAWVLPRGSPQHCCQYSQHLMLTVSSPRITTLRAKPTQMGQILEP